MLRMISTKVHGVLDYLVGVLLIVLPTLLGFSSQGLETWTMVGLGIATLVYSLLTRYELGLVRLLSMPLHLGIDLISGLLLTFSPWLFGFADRVFLPHVIAGIAEIAVFLLSTPEVVRTPGPTVHHPQEYHVKP